MKISISTKKGTQEFELAPTATLQDLKVAFHKKNSRFNPDRQRLVKIDNGKKVPLTQDSATLTSQGVKEGEELQFKDLGPQIGYQTVFYIEYLGPILIHALFYYLPELFYGENNIFNKVLPFIFTAGAIPERSSTQNLIFYLVVAHFIKRELETAFVHKFSHATMPIFNLYKNCAHYWFSGGILLGYVAYHPQAPVIENTTAVYIALGLFIFAELSNLHTHLTLSNLRKPGETHRKIPVGYGFNWVSCPNYFFEILAWAAVTILVPHYLSAFFWISGAVQMWFWAVKKHRKYKEDFKNYPRGRKVMVPFVL